MKKRIFVILILFSFEILIVRADILNGWISYDDNLFYYLNGVVQKGITKIEGKDYFIG